MSEPDIGGRAPIRMDVEAGKSYWWCACGRSKTQPFCDGSHKVTSFTPVEYKPEVCRQCRVLHLQALGQEAALRRQPQTPTACLNVFLNPPRRGA